MDRDLFMKKIIPFNEKYIQKSVLELLKTENLTSKINENPNILTKTILTDDILGYMEVHDIDPNIYRYVHTIETTDDFFYKAPDLRWSLILNGKHVEELLRKDKIENILLFEEIENKVQEYVPGEGYKGDGIYPIMKPDPWPYESLSGPEKQWAKLYIKDKPNVKRYLDEPKNENDDDDNSDSKIFKEDVENKNFNKYTSWLKIRIEMIHNHLYIFSVNRLTINDLYFVKSSQPHGYIHYGNNLPAIIEESKLFFPYKSVNNIMTHYKPTEVEGDPEFYYVSNFSYFLIPKYKRGAENGLEWTIKNNIRTFERLGVVTNRNIFYEGNNYLKPEFIIYLMRNISFMELIQLGPVDYEVDFPLWSAWSTKRMTYDSFLTYRGNIDDVILGWVNDYENFDPEETHYGKEMILFNKLTNNKCRELVPDISNAIDLPDNYNFKSDKELANYLRDNDYDLFMSYHKISHEINKRINMKDIQVVDETLDGMEHGELEAVNIDSSKFFKISVYNFRRNPFDLFICDLLYTGKMIVEREHHWDHIYIPVVQLWKFIKLNKLEDVLSNRAKDLWGVYYHV